MHEYGILYRNKTTDSTLPGTYFLIKLKVFISLLYRSEIPTFPQNEERHGLKILFMAASNLVTDP